MLVILYVWFVEIGLGYWIKESMETCLSSVMVIQNVWSTGWVQYWYIVCSLQEWADYHIYHVYVSFICTMMCMLHYYCMICNKKYCAVLHAYALSSSSSSSSSMGTVLEQCSQPRSSKQSLNIIDGTST